MGCRRPGILALALVSLLAGCGREPVDPRPSILLVVIDTLRADAVSAYGAVEGTTPSIDALAEQGLLYERAYAPSPWTVPSHATLFTGLGPERHGTGMFGRMVIPESLPTLAERLRDAGYRTAIFSENALVGEPFGMTRGFDHVAVETYAKLEQRALGRIPPYDVEAEVRRWLARDDPAAPVFVFVNLMDVHDPYIVRDENPFVPDGLPVDETDLRKAGVPAGSPIAWASGICDRLPSREALAVLRGLYLGEAHAADAKLGTVQAVLAEAMPGLVTVATSDHGEHLGEHRLLGHEYSVRHAVLGIPLVVAGLPRVVPARIEASVTLADVAVSILDWAGVEPLPGLDGRPLPTTAGGDGGPLRMLAAFTDDRLRMPGLDLIQDHYVTSRKRAGCGETEKVFGDTLALLRYPHKLIWFENHESELYDLSWDPEERTDLAAREPALRAELEQELATLVRGSRLEEPDVAEQPSEESLEALRALGYGD